MLISFFFKEGKTKDSDQYIGDTGKINLLHPCATTDDKFEISCLQGNLFEGVERFDDLKSAESRIARWLFDFPPNSKVELKDI